MRTAPLCDSRTDHLTGNALLGAGIVHHIIRVVLAPQQSITLSTGSEKERYAAGEMRAEFSVQ
jgi:hypothetical protein